MPTRRDLLAGFGAAGALSLLGFGAPARAAQGSERLVLVILRGGLDGLSAISPLGDPRFEELRGGFEDSSGHLPLDGHFALHPGLAPIHPLWDRGQLGFVHAMGLDYGARSHFDAQDQLENGSGQPNGAPDGWLGRALGRGSAEGLAFSKNLPLVLRGPGSVSSLDPARETRSDIDFQLLVERMYAADPVLGPALLEGLETRRELDRMTGAVKARKDSPQAVKKVAAVLRQPSGPSVGVLELGGWDTHVRQSGRLGGLLSELGEGLATLASELGETWQQTLVVVVSEFGRTARPNGTAGTDHGTAGLGLVLGGLTRGGLLGEWPGLARLHEDRDLLKANETRSLFKGALQLSLGLSERALNEVFPGSERTPTLAL